MTIVSNKKLLHDGSATGAIHAFRSRLNSAERKTGHTYGRQTAVFPDELHTLLSELKESSVDPRQGIELVLEFFRSDEIFFE